MALPNGVTGDATVPEALPAEPLGAFEFTGVHFRCIRYNLKDGRRDLPEALPSEPAPRLLPHLAPVVLLLAQGGAAGQYRCRSLRLSLEDAAVGYGVSARGAVLIGDLEEYPWSYGGIHDLKNGGDAHDNANRWISSLIS